MSEVIKVLWSCIVIPYIGHQGGESSAHKVLQYGLFLPSPLNDSIYFVKDCTNANDWGLSQEDMRYL